MGYNDLSFNQKKAGMVAGFADEQIKSKDHPLSLAKSLAPHKSQKTQKRSLACQDLLCALCAFCGQS
jgi:hypothetical protein